jgi:uncharacterized protein
MNCLLPEGLKNQVTSRILKSVPDVAAIYAYGSRIKGAVHPESDLDLALLLPPAHELHVEILAQLEGDLEALAGCAVEVSVLERTRSVVHCKEVITSGIPIFIADIQAVEGFEMMVFSEYARFCDDRAPVLQAYSMENSSG